jgi:hypothetical protein
LQTPGRSAYVAPIPAPSGQAADRHKGAIMRIDQVERKADRPRSRRGARAPAEGA